MVGKLVVVVIESSSRGGGGGGGVDFDVVVAGAVVADRRYP